MNEGTKMQIRNVSKRLRQRNGISATIARGGLSCFLDHAANPNVGVVLGRNSQDALTQNDIRFEVDAQDLLINAAQYAPTGAPSAPLIGDKVTMTVNGFVCVFETRPIGDSQQCFKTCDADGTELRLHCKLMSQT